MIMQTCRWSHVYQQHAFAIWRHASTCLDNYQLQHNVLLLACCSGIFSDSTEARSVDDVDMARPASFATLSKNLLPRPASRARPEPRMISAPAAAVRALKCGIQGCLRLYFHSNTAKRHRTYGYTITATMSNIDSLQSCACTAI
jgi:hypothetical protein